MRHTISPVALLICAGAATLSAQKPSGFAATDSAAAARAAWSRAGNALRQNDLAGARKEVDRAAAAWPTQQTYPWTSAVLASRANDTTAVISALRRLASIGLGRDIASDTGIARLASRPEIAKLRAILDANRAPLARSRRAAELPDSSFWPEGMDVDASTGRIYVASIRFGTIAEFTPGGGVREILARRGPNIGSLFGVRFNPRTGMLWATAVGSPNAEGHQPADSLIAALLEIRPSDAKIMRRFDLPPAPGGHTLGDLAIGPNGDVFVTDSNEPVFYQLRPNGTQLEPLRHPLFHNLQGMAPSPDGRTVIVADYSHGLLRVDLQTGTVARLADAPGSTSLGCDGIAWHADGIVAVQNGVTPPRVMLFKIDKSQTRITAATVLDRNIAIADEPTIGAVHGNDFLYVANGQWDKHADDGTVLKGAKLVPPLILSVPIRP